MQKDVISLLWYLNELTAGQNKYSYTFKGHSVFSVSMLSYFKGNKTKRQGEWKRKNSRVTKEERLKKGEDYLYTFHLFESQMCVDSVVV